MWPGPGVSLHWEPLMDGPTHGRFDVRFSALWQWWGCGSLLKFLSFSSFSVKVVGIPLPCDAVVSERAS
jgi:hypothetical protein